MRALARLALLLGAIGGGLLLYRASPRQLDLVYDLGRRPGATGLEVEIRRGPELLRRAELKVPPAGGQVHHPVRLPDGDYQLAFRIATPSGPVELSRSLQVREAGPVVLPLGP